MGVREDFYYRLNVFPIFLPSLKDRKTDVLLLSEHFLEKYARENNKNIERLSPAVINLLYAYNWPGNVRELENCIERAVILCNADTLQPTHLPATLQSSSSAVVIDESLTSFKDLTENYEKKIIIYALHKVKGNVSITARLLQTTSRILGYKISQYDIDTREIKKIARS